MEEEEPLPFDEDADDDGPEVYDEDRPVPINRIWTRIDEPKIRPVPDWRDPFDNRDLTEIFPW